MNRVLIVDNNPSFAQELTVALQHRACVCETVLEGTEVLSKAHAFQPSAIVLCVELHKISGYSVCNKLRKDPVLRDVVLVLMSRVASAETFEEHQSLKTRADAYVREPCTVQAVLDALVSVRFFKDNLAPAVLLEEHTLIALQDNNPIEEEPPMEVSQPAVQNTAAFEPLLQHEEDIEVPIYDVSADWIEEAAPVLPADVQLPEEVAQEATQALAASMPELLQNPPVLASVLEPSAAQAVAKPAVVAHVGTENFLEQLRNENRQLRSKIQKLEQSIEEKALSFNDRLLEESARAREALELKRKLSTVDRQVVQFQQAIEKGRAELEEAQQQSTQLKTQLAQAESVQTRLSDELAALQEQLQTALQELHAVRANMAALETYKTTALEDLASKKAIHDQVKTHVEQALQAIAELDA
jgi:CheY-like chemotaxis protein